MGDNYFYTRIIQPTAILIGLVTESQTKDEVNDYLDELELLADTAGAKTVQRFIQKMDIPNPTTYVGKGKLTEIALFVKSQKIDVVIFDDELTPSQLRNIEKTLEKRILDRTHLILDIFATRAQTAYAKTQVELAQYQYLLPRLTRMWTHLERQKGGIGLRGPGETEIETDRRIIRDRISLLKKKLEKIDKQKLTQKKHRGKLVRVSLIGYTNVGKSTIMNMLSKSRILVENKLFATLDTTVRKVVIKNLPFLLSDTVGFIRKLPHNLVESFKSTLDEVRETDILLHIVDISNPQFEDQINIVHKTLCEIEAKDKQIFLIFNKVDAYSYIKKEVDDLTPKTKENLSIEELKNRWVTKPNINCVFISAKEKKNIEELKELIYENVKKIHVTRFPYNDFLYDD